MLPQSSTSALPAEAGAVVASPEAALLLFAAGVMLITVECLRPGRVVPGAGGLLFVLVSVHRLALEPLRLSGILLSVLALAVFVFAASMPLRGAAGVVGTCLLSVAAAVLPGPPASIGHLLLRLWAGIVVGCSLALLPAAALARRNKRSPSGSRGPRAWSTQSPE